MNTTAPIPSPSPSPSPSRWSRLGDRLVCTFHAYATWLVGISWKRFFLLAVLLLITSGILKDLLTFQVQATVDAGSRKHTPRHTPADREPKPATRSGEGQGDGSMEGIDISIDAQGIRITKRPGMAASAGSAASAASAVSAASGAASPDITHIALSSSEREEISKVLQALREEIRAALRDSVGRAHAQAEDDRDEDSAAVLKHGISLGEFFPNLAMLWIVASIIIKITYKGELLARADAVQAHLNTESEQVRRQAAEARVAAVQAQVEPHFLFNTLASIDHLIETDPPRASRMQKSLIALLRATLPNLRDDSTQGPLRTLGQEADVIVPYLDIMKVRMEDRLQMEVDIPEGLRSAQFPPLMLQGLVENAIKHGLEPKAEGGQLRVRAQVVDGALCLSVRDTGVGLGPASHADHAAPSPSTGSGTGLANIRERLKLLFGERAKLVLSSLPEGGTLATLTLPYQVQPTNSNPAPSQA